MDYQLLNLFDDHSRKLPDFSFSCKFILIESSSGLWLVFGPLRVYRYHAQLLHKFCSDFDIASDWVKKPDLVEIFDAKYKAAGGGQMMYDRKNKHIKFSGESTAYGRFSRDALNVLLTVNGSFTNCSVSFET